MTTKHWPTLLLGVIVAAVFLVKIFTFQVKSTEHAIVTTFKKIEKKPVEAGLGFRVPYIQKVHYFDKRRRCFDGTIGKIEETYTADQMNVTVGIYVVYNIDDPVELYKSVETEAKAEEKLNSLMRTEKDGVIGQYSFNELVNTDRDKMKLSNIETEIAGRLDTEAGKYGLKIHYVGIKVLGLPEQVSAQVFERMKSERKKTAQKFRSDGEKRAQEIKNAANTDRYSRIKEAEAEAIKIKGEGDAAAAAYYAVFQEAPELAAFLRRLDAIRQTSKQKMTLFLSTSSIPFDVFSMDDEKLKSFDVKKKAETEKK